MNNLDVPSGQQQVRDEVGSYCQKLFQNFLQEFKVDDTIKYLEPAKELVSPERCTLEVSFDDIESYHQALSTSIIEEYYRVYPYLCQALENFLKDRVGLKGSKQCYVSLIDVPTRHNLRELTTPKIGTLIRISGQVIRTYPVHPELVYGTFICADCNSVIKNVEQQFKYTEPTICSNPQCQNRRRFYIDTDESVFVDFQKINIQETQAELPKGCIPRTLEVIIRGEAVEIVQPGDKYDFTGTLIVVPDVSVLSYPGAKAELSSRPKLGEQMDGIRGLKALGVRDLNYKLSFLSCSVNATTLRHGGTELGEEEVTPDLMKQRMSEVEWNRIYEMSRDKNLYSNIVASLFPSIHGNEEVKRGVTLMLFGGVPKTTEEGTSLRGDINCCIVGDPSTAKSQLLKLVAEITPRAIYTSGKASSAAGLTAAVVRDEESGDFVIEAGALMLADNGICCIDEFDKMDPRDVVAIHEAMEQQTISIAKAGVRATLNARTSILAAANPIGGRYDRSKSLKDNLMMSAPIMSRFDLFFVLVDECNEIIDTAIATRIIDLHSNNLHNLSTHYTLDDVMRYIDFARRFKPIINEEAGKLLVDSYTALRQREGTGAVSSTWRVTVRQLESLIRLSEAMAKLECSDEVTVKHVKEARNLLNKSIVRVEQPDIDLEDDDVPEEEATENDEAEMEVDDPKIQKKRFNISFNEYKSIMDLLVNYLHQKEIEMEESDEILDDNEKMGVKKSELIAWYLDQIGDKIEDENDLYEKKCIIEKIIRRLLYVDNVLIPLNTYDLSSGKKRIDDETEDEDPIIVVHPNYQTTK